MKKYLVIALCISAVFLSSCEKDVSVTGVTLDKATLALCVSGTGNLMATIQPSDVYGRVKWSSSDTLIATVVDGTVTGVSEGTAQIVATVGSYTATCDVTISASVTSITLSKTSVRLKIDSTQTLTPTLLPAQPEAVVGNITWTSTNPLVATVTSNGKITAVSLGSATIVASIGTATAVCSVSVFDTTPNSLMGTNYYLINIDNASATDVIGSSNIVADFRADGVKNNFYVWNGLNAGTCSGASFYGTSETWLSLVVAGAVGWSGAAYNVATGTELNKLKAVTDDVSGKYYLHFAIKSTTTNSYAFKLGYGNPAAVTFVLGTAAMESTNPYGNFTRNGQWQEVEIPMSYFKGKGLAYTTGKATTDVFVMLAGSTAGIKLEIDAVFIYKKP